MKRSLLLAGLAVTLGVSIAACAGSTSGNSSAATASQAAGASPAAASATPLYDAKALPPGREGKLIAYGRALFMHTQKYAPRNVAVTMSCSACHVAGGTVKRGGYLRIYGQFPQWNGRSKRFIFLQDRIAECFLYSMNGTPPPYTSKTMIAMTAYLAYISRGQPTMSKPDPQIIIAQFKAPAPPSIARGSKLYAGKCSMCHGANGSGSATFPPLWGAKSFNNGAGMEKVAMMAGFVRYNMPQNAPGTLTDQQSYDVAAFVLSHARPKFVKNRMIVFPPVPASFF
ncbi:MAG: c-type cytochrome [Vulcanimicrobiaceae bacterium]